MPKSMDQELIPCGYSSRSSCSSCLGRPSSKKPKAPWFQIGSGWNLAGLFFKYIHVKRRRRIFDLTSHFQDGGHDVISHRNVLPSDECSAQCTRSVRSAPIDMLLATALSTGCLQAILSRVPDPLYIRTFFAVCKQGQK